MKTASQSAQKFVERASAASGDYVSGAQTSTKDQAAAAIAGKANYIAGVKQLLLQEDMKKVCKLLVKQVG